MQHVKCKIADSVFKMQCLYAKPNFFGIIPQFSKKHATFCAMMTLYTYVPWVGGGGWWYVYVKKSEKKTKKIGIISQSKK